MEKILYYDYCAIILMIAMICILLYRRFVYGASNKTFIFLICGMLLTTIFDMGMEHIVIAKPIGPVRLAFANFLTYGYYLLRNASNLIYILYILVTTKPFLKIRKYAYSTIIYAPYAIIVGIIFSNLFTGKVFSITAEEGYVRGPHQIMLYIVSVAYTFVGIMYLIKSYSYIEKDRWFILILQYPLTLLAVAIQYFFPQQLIEMFAMSISVLLVMMLVQKPGEAVDPKLKLLNKSSFINEMRKYEHTKDAVSLIIIRLTNSYDVRSSLGETKFNRYISNIASRLKKKIEQYEQRKNIYFDQSGCFFITLESEDFDMEHLVPKEIGLFNKELKDTNNYGLRFDHKICTLRFPTDIADVESLLHFAAVFPELMESSMLYTQASYLAQNKDFQLRNNMSDILDKAIKNKSLEMYYQPIYSFKDDAFISAEALVRLKDSKFGFVPPSIFIPAAEHSSFIQPIGDFIIEDVFRFISRTDFKDIGLKYIEINLSVSQCIQRNLSEKILALKNLFGIKPEQVNFEITESAYDNSRSIMDSNINTLANEGFTISLDDYGTGYSNMQRILNIPLSIIKIDKSLVDNMKNAKGMSIVKNTVSMMHDINMHLVAEGVETKEMLDKLKAIGTDFIQGYYFSRPLPEKEFLDFMKNHNKKKA